MFNYAGQETSFRFSSCNCICRILRVLRASETRIYSVVMWNNRRRKCQKCCEFCAKSQSLKIWFTFDLGSAADIPQSHLNLWNSSIQTAKATTKSRLIDFDLFFSGSILHRSCGFSIGGISIIAKSTWFSYYSWVLVMKFAIPRRHFFRVVFIDIANSAGYCGRMSGICDD